MALDLFNKLSRLVGPTNVAANASIIFTGTVSHIYTIKKIRIVNPTGSAISIELGINGVAASQLILPYSPIDAGGFAESDDFIVLTGAEQLYAYASLGGLTITIIGLDQS